MKGMRRKVRALVFKEGKWLVGQFLEYDIAAQAKTFPKLVKELWRMLVAEALICEHEKMQSFNKTKAPASYWRVFNQHGKPVIFGKDPYATCKIKRPTIVEIRVAKRPPTPDAKER